MRSSTLLNLVLYEPKRRFGSDDDREIKDDDLVSIVYHFTGMKWEKPGSLFMGK